ncbi:hypothetical protein PARHAE_00331 [Paracoccus haematequi]|uniref:Uncharacterized protein n=1 Tax=Paracoccus haematequi TaxID=2491866 RepID=A0A447II46_9RHOB|nr:hypothetical protein PARHAE_00331 [Paracoccus haematequi]
MFRPEDWMRIFRPRKPSGVTTGEFAVMILKPLSH